MKLIKSYCISMLSISLAALILTTVDITTISAILLVPLAVMIIHFVVSLIGSVLVLPVLAAGCFTLITFGFGIFIIDGLIFLLAAKYVDGFFIASFWAAVWLSLINAIINTVLSPKSKTA